MFEHARSQLSAVAAAISGSQDTVELLSMFGTEADAESSAAQVAEWLEMKVSNSLDELVSNVLGPFFCSSECDQLIDTLCERPSQGVGLPALQSSSTWLEMFCAAAEKLPQAVSVVDMQVAGLPLVFVNEAWELLTGYKRAEALGRNCRILQGPATEPSAIAQLVSSIRTRSKCTVQLTNYTKGGKSFVNELTLQPVCDTQG
eukprot:4059610-Prymnesium_polylepis.1